jgi:hypothetical protein
VTAKARSKQKQAVVKPRAKRGRRSRATMTKQISGESDVELIDSDLSDDDVDTRANNNKTNNSQVDVGLRKSTSQEAAPVAPVAQTTAAAAAAPPPITAGVSEEDDYDE